MTARRVPVFATLVVALAVAAMVALGAWQLQRRSEKAALLARYATNVSAGEIAFPQHSDDTVLFRRAHLVCASPIRFSSDGGRHARGGTGWRQIARCGDPARGAGPVVQLGLSDDPHARPNWPGGNAYGYVSYAPDHAPLIANLFGATPKSLMLVADPPLGAFAAIATVIYGLALRRRMVAAPAPGR